jgi:hypothetical protein
MEACPTSMVNPTTATVSLQLNTSALAIYTLPEKVIMEAWAGGQGRVYAVGRGFIKMGAGERALLTVYNQNERGPIKRAYE